VAILDVVWGGVTPAVAFLLRDGAIKAPNAVTIYCGVATLISLLVFQWFQTSSPLARFYSIRDAFELIKACALIVALSAVATFVLARLDEAPRSIPILQFMLLAPGLLGVRILLRLWSSRREGPSLDSGKKVEHVVIIQATRLAWFFTKMIDELAPGHYQIVAILDEDPRLKYRSLNGYPIIGTPKDLERIIADYVMHGVHVDKVVLATNPKELTSQARNEIERVCQTRNINFDLLPELLMSKGAVADDEISFAPQSQAHNVTNLVANLGLDRPYWKIKRLMDFLISTVVAILFSPIALALCLLVALDVGIPLVFWQRRVGRNGVPIHLYKFRTLHTLFNRQTKERRDAQEPSLIGRFLQGTRLDELPQLWNILSGEMSLIGPRPLLPVDQPDDFRARLLVRPGLTGWAQVCGGKLITVEEKKALDEWYIRHASFWLDVMIIFRTIWMLLFTGDRRDEEKITLAFLDCSRGEDINISVSAAVTSEDKNEPGGLVNRIEAVSS
jgi:lipopolysaccharide/colanic/teichoic acid biosynthesis glycosyltransferase